MPIGKNLPVLPDSWVWCQVQDVGEAMLGRQRTSRAQSAETIFPYLRVANVQDDAIDLSELTYMHFTAEERERYRLEPYDILLCEGQSPELVGRSAMYRGELPELFFQNHLIRFRCGPYLDPEYALLVFRSYMHDGTFQSVATSTTNLANLGLGRFKKVPFPLPPLKVQAHLAEMARAAQQELDYLRQRLYSIRGYFDSAASVIRDYEMLSGPVDLSAAELPQIPGGGRWVKAAETVPTDAPIVYGIVQPGVPQEPGNGIPYVRGQDIRDGEILIDALPWTSHEISAKYSRSTVNSGDVLLSIIRYMRAAVVPNALAGANISRGAARFRPADDVDGAYLAHWLESRSAQRWLQARLRGTGMPGLNLSDLRQLPVPVPPLEVQRQVAERLDGQTATTREIAQRLDACERLVAVTERSFLRALTGGDPIFVLTDRISDAGPDGAEILTRLRALMANPESHARAREAGVATVANRRSRKGREPNQRRAVTEVVRDSTTPLPPEEVFRRTGIPVESVDEFFAELRTAVQSRLIIVDRPDDSNVFIRRAS
ncbi:restriction endonuclease subunit S [Micromonospora sp. NPDC005707]|uniref:restriction endonuclease subunit S n=1 Tax=Micromonospora sp. NPDC005707 TaxID=3157050 RepID=UPI0033E564A4